MYECTAENDLRVSKVVYNLRDDDNNLLRTATKNEPAVDLLQIGSSMRSGEQTIESASINKLKRPANGQQSQQNNRSRPNRPNKKVAADENSSTFSSISKHRFDTTFSKKNICVIFYLILISFLFFFFLKIT